MSDDPNSSNNIDWKQFWNDKFLDESFEEMGHFILKNPPRTIVPGDQEGGAERLYQDYFSSKPVYPEHIFRRRFRMRRELFLHIVEELGKNSEYFQQRVDAAKRLGLSPFQKCTGAIRILAYGSPADAIDEYIKIGESTAFECLFKFCHAIIDVFGDVYMRKPTYNDVQRLLEMYEKFHGFPGMLGSLDCMHWAWKNCTVQLHGKGNIPEVIMGIQQSCLKQSP